MPSFEWSEKKKRKKVSRQGRDEQKSIRPGRMKAPLKKRFRREAAKKAPDRPSPCGAGRTKFM